MMEFIILRFRARAPLLSRRVGCEGDGMRIACSLAIGFGCALTSYHPLHTHARTDAADARDARDDGSDDGENDDDDARDADDDATGRSRARQGEECQGQGAQGGTRAKE
jgi:hypothetical protein